MKQLLEIVELRRRRRVVEGNKNFNNTCGVARVQRPEVPTPPIAVLLLIQNCERQRSIQQWNETAIIQTVEHNRHEGTVLQRGARNALTISGQQAYHKRPIALVSH